MGIPLVWRQYQRVDATAELWVLFWGEWRLGQVEELDEGGSVVSALGGRSREMNMGRDDAMQMVATLVAAHFVEATSCLLNHSDRIRKEEAL